MGDVTGRVSARGQVEPFHVMEVLKAAAARQASHGDLLLMCVGQPSTPAPAAARAAAVSALESDVLGYTEAVGTPAFRTVLARHYRDTYGVEVALDEVIVTTGSSGGFQLVLMAAFDPGDLVAMTLPGYPAYRNDIQALGCRVLDLPCDASTRYQPTVEMLEALPEKPRGLVVASPANPTGTMLEPEELAALARWCEANDCLLISDEIYHGITFGARAASAWETSRAAVVVGSISKYYSMTGWRLGWLLLPEHLRRPVELLQGNLAICAPAVSQAAACAAFGDDARAELDEHVARYARNRDVVLRRLPELGITNVVAPQGAFYAYCDVRHLTTDSQSWCEEVLGATGVALTPGIDFDPDAGRHHIRLSFSGSTTDVNDAFDRLVAWVGGPGIST